MRFNNIVLAQYLIKRLLSKNHSICLNSFQYKLPIENHHNFISFLKFKKLVKILEFLNVIFLFKNIDFSLSTLFFHYLAVMIKTKN